MDEAASRDLATLIGAGTATLIGDWLIEAAELLGLSSSPSG